MHQFDVSVVLPAKNEAKNLSALLREIAEVVPSTTTEIIVVDDGSSDDSLALLHNLSSTLPVSCRVIVHPMSCGQSTSVFHGVLQAKGKWIITLDADGQNDPADIPRLIRAAKETNAAHFCVIGHRQKRKDTPWKRFQSKVANRVRQWILQDDTPDTGCGLKLLPRSTFLLLPYFDHMHRYIPALTKRLGGDV
ncbi:MAG: glycosyltransferase family 2 protein, partial [Pseudomonadota bacterium]|nr:glycosyltransferase family 2 protein [Pseudomonadota bacterium]